HVAVADGLDLFQIVVVGEFIKSGENTVQRLNQFSGRKPCRQGRKCDNVGKENRGVVEAVRDDPDLLFEFVGDGSRQHVEEQALVLPVEVSEGEMVVHAGQQLVRVKRLGDLIHGAQLKCPHKVSRIVVWGEDTY